MRKLLTGVLAGAVIAFIGCSTPSSKVGGPGAVPSSGKDPLIGKKAGTFTLNFNKHNIITAGIAYTWFFGGGPKNLSQDRDFLGAE